MTGGAHSRTTPGNRMDINQGMVEMTADIPVLVDPSLPTVSKNCQSHVWKSKSWCRSTELKNAVQGGGWVWMTPSNNNSFLGKYDCMLASSMASQWSERPFCFGITKVVTLKRTDSSTTPANNPPVSILLTEFWAEISRNLSTSSGETQIGSSPS